METRSKSWKHCQKCLETLSESTVRKLGNTIRKFWNTVRKSESYETLSESTVRKQENRKHCQKVWKHCQKSLETLSESSVRRLGNTVRKTHFTVKKHESLLRTLSMPGEKEQKQFRNIDRKRNKAHKFVLLMARRMAYCLKATYSTSHFPFKFLIKASKGNFHF